MVWLPFDFGQSSKRHEEERHRWRRKAQGDTSIQGEECSGQREWPVQRSGHGTVWGALGERRVAGVGAGLWRVNANSNGRLILCLGCACTDSFNPCNPARQALLLPPFYRWGNEGIRKLSN